MVYLIVRLLVNAGVIMALPYIIPDISISNFYYALIAAFVLGLVNVLVKPLIKLITLPISIITLGLFNLVINAVLLWFVASFIQGFEIVGFWPAFWGALVISVVNVIMNWLKK